MRNFILLSVFCLSGLSAYSDQVSFDIKNRLTVHGWWKQARMSHAFRKGILDEVKSVGGLWRLQQDDRGRWRIASVNSHVHRVETLQSRRWTVQSAEPRKAEVGIRALSSADVQAKVSSSVAAWGSAVDVTAADAVGTNDSAAFDFKCGKKADGSGGLKPVLKDVSVSVNGFRTRVPFEMHAGDYAQLVDGAWTLYDELGNPKRRVKCDDVISLGAGANAAIFESSDKSARAEVAVFGVGTSKDAFGVISDKNRRWFDHEAVLPAFFAPSAGFAGNVKIAPRLGERASLELEIWGPADSPSVKVGRRTWTFPVKLAENEYVVCRDGVRWEAKRVVCENTSKSSGQSSAADSSRCEKIAEGRLSKALPSVEKPLDVSLGAKDTESCRAMFLFAKRYQKPYRLWTIDEIKAGVKDSQDTVSVSYQEGGFSLASITEDGVDLSYLGKVGKGRCAQSRVFVVPAAIYDSAKIRVSVDDDSKKDRVFTVRLTRYNDGPNYGGRDFAGMMNVAVDFDKAVKRRLPDGNWELDVPLDMGCIADFVWGGDMFGTWLNNSIIKGRYTPRKGLENYLDFEILPRLVKFRSPMQDARMCPDANFVSAVTVHGVQLHKSGLEFEIIQSQTGNVFAAGEKPETSVRVSAAAPGDWSLRCTIRDIEGRVLKDEVKGFSGERTFTFDLAEKTVGWYSLDYAVAKGATVIMTHRASFALLAPDTRKEGIGEGPYGSWNYGGAHYNLRSLEEYGPLLEKAGLRRCMGVTGTNAHPWKVSPVAISWRGGKLSYEERVADIRRQRQENPNVTTFLVFHENAPWGYQHAWELTGQKVPDPKTFGNAGWVCSGSRSDAFAKRAARHTLAMERCAFMRKEFPEVKITIGNSLACTEIIAEALRDGLPKEYVDYMGIESVVRNQLPEREGDMCFQVADLMMQLARHFGCDKWRPNATWESGYRTDTLIGLDKQASWQIRDVLLEQAWRFPDIFIGILTDCGNSYGGSFWGGSGLCWRAPTAYPKPVYVGVANVTRLLDQVVSSRRIPCGDECVYVNEYLRRDGRRVTALWTTRGEAEIELRLGSGKVEYIDFWGRPYEPVRNVGGLWSRFVSKRNPVVKAGEFAKYILSDSAVVVSAQVGDRRFPGWGREPSDAKLVAKTDSAAEWRLESETNKTIEITRGPFLPYRTLGKYEVREVVDEERGKCLELELVNPNYSLPLIMSEYAVLELKKPVPLDGDPSTLGAWVKGNSGWGQFYWVLEDEKGARHYSCGQGANADVFDYDGTVSICYTGWNYLRMPIDGRSPVRNLSTGGVGIMWRGGAPAGKMKLAGVAFSAMNRPLFLTERRAHTQKIRIGGIFASDYD